MAALGFLLHHIHLSAPFPMFGFFRILTVFVFLIESNRYEQILFIRPSYPQTLVRFFKLHAFCRCPAQPFGRRFGYRDGVAAKPAAGQLCREIRSVLGADFQLFRLVRCLCIRLVCGHHDVFGDIDQLVPDSQCSAFPS